MRIRLLSILLAFILPMQGWAATTVRSNSTGTAATGTAVTVAKPAGCVSGDLSIVSVAANGNTTIVDNNGGTTFTEDLNDYQETTTSQTVSIFSRRMTGSEPDPYAFTIGASDRWTAHADCFQNPHASVIYDGNPTGTNGANTGGTGFFSSAAVTTAYNNSIVMQVGVADNSGNSINSTPSGYTVEQNSGNQAMAFADKVKATAGTEAAQTFGLVQEAGWIAVSFAIVDQTTSIGPTCRGALLLTGVGGC